MAVLIFGSPLAILTLRRLKSPLASVHGLSYRALCFKMHGSQDKAESLSSVIIACLHDTVRGTTLTTGQAQSRSAWYPVRSNPIGSWNRTSGNGLGSFACILSASFHDLFSSRKISLPVSVMNHGICIARFKLDNLFIPSAYRIGIPRFYFWKKESQYFSIPPLI
jgi:hypothetical protein